MHERITCYFSIVLHNKLYYLSLKLNKTLCTTSNVSKSPSSVVFIKIHHNTTFTQFEFQHFLLINVTCTTYNIIVHKRTIIILTLVFQDLFET